MEVFHPKDTYPKEGWMHMCISCEDVTGNVVKMEMTIVYICKRCEDVYLKNKLNYNGHI
tara:strand:- start:267 stop:443 length:177 start_codon:yes stop_codon:yes gene_type:complete